MNTAPRNKVLIVAPGGSFFTDPFFRAFSRSGYECKTFNSRQGAVYENSFLRKIIRRFPVLRFLKKLQVGKINDSLLDMVRQYQPDYLFAQKGESITPETIEAIKKLGVVTINLYNDMMNQWNVISRIAPVYDYFFHVDYVVLQRLWQELGLKNCYHMALAAEPMPDPFTNRQEIYPISFIGTHNNALYSNREDYMDAIKDLGLHIWGTDGWGTSPVASCFHGPSVGDQRFDIYRKSKIVLDINYNAFPTDLLSNRTFDVMGCGALYMTDGDGRAAREAYIEDAEIVFFRDEKELREKIAYYLSHDEERQAIARAGYVKTMTGHTYDARVHRIFEIIEKK